MTARLCTSDHESVFMLAGALQNGHIHHQSRVRQREKQTKTKQKTTDSSLSPLSQLDLRPLESTRSFAFLSFRDPLSCPCLVQGCRPFHEI